MNYLSGFISKIKSFLKKFPVIVGFKRKVWGVLFFSTKPQLYEIRNMILYYQTKSLQEKHPNPLNKFGKKCFSQTDEDGLTIEILRRINKLEGGVYAEFGVGNGTENNTLILAALGWKGFWVGGENIVFNVNDGNGRFFYIKEWITLDNIVDLTKKGLDNIGAIELDVISLDLDGNDIYLVERLLAKNYKPKVFIVEYNGKFPPPVKFQISYNENHTWMSDDYFGASLSSFNELFKANGYKLVCCNSHSGANAFFVLEEYSSEFSDVPENINDIFVEPRYHLYSHLVHQTYSHKTSPSTINKIING